MPDDIDNAQDRQEAFLDSTINHARAEIPEGVEGDCELCGEWFGRLVAGACVPCREKHKLE